MKNKDIEIGKRMEYLRRSRSIEKTQQTQVAAETGLSKGTIGRVENGHLPKDLTLDILVDYYGARKEWVLTGDGPIYKDQPGSPKYTEKIPGQSQVCTPESVYRPTHQIDIEEQIVRYQRQIDNLLDQIDFLKAENKRIRGDDP